MFLSRHLCLDFWVRIIDDCQEHIQKNEEDEEDIENKVGRAKDVVCLVQLHKFKLTKQNAKLWKSVHNKTKAKEITRFETLHYQQTLQPLLPQMNYTVNWI